MGILDMIIDSANRGASMIAPTQADVEMRPKVAKGLLEMLPGSGDALSGYEAYQSAKEGDWRGAGLNGVGLFPFVPSMAGMIKQTSPYGIIRELSRRLDSAGIPHEISKSKSTKSAYLNNIETGKGDFDYPLNIRVSDHPTDMPHQARQVFKKYEPDPNYDADVFPNGGHSKDFAEKIIMDLIGKTRR